VLAGAVLTPQPPALWGVTVIPYTEIMLPEGFMKRVQVDAEKGCWLWMGGKDMNGYGRYYLSEIGTKVYAHRYAYEAKHGPVPVGLVLDHFVCSTPQCCNPDHVRPVTIRENSLRSTRSVAAIHSQKIHCVNGHEFTPENTGRRPDNGTRYCKVCHQERKRARRAELRSQGIRPT